MEEVYGSNIMSGIITGYLPLGDPFYQKKVTRITLILGNPGEIIEINVKLKMDTDWSSPYLLGIGAEESPLIVKRLNCNLVGNRLQVAVYSEKTVPLKLYGLSADFVVLNTMGDVI